MSQMSDKDRLAVEGRVPESMMLSQIKLALYNEKIKVEY